MSKKFTIEKVNRKISDYNVNAKMVNMINKSGADHIKNGTMTQEMYEDIIDANIIHGIKHEANVGYGTGYLNGYRDCQKDTVNTVLATTAGCAIGLGIFKYRKEIKDYGKYVIGKFKKGRD